MCRCFSLNFIRTFALLSVAIFAQVGLADQQRSGEALYQDICQYCHDTGIGPQLWARQLPSSYISYVVRHGQKAMPAFRLTEISKAELTRVATFIETSKGQTGKGTAK